MHAGRWVRFLSRPLVPEVWWLGLPRVWSFCLVLRHARGAGSIPVGDSGGVGVSEGLLFPCL